MNIPIKYQNKSDIRNLVEISKQLNYPIAILNQQFTIDYIDPYMKNYLKETNIASVTNRSIEFRNCELHTKFINLLHDLINGNNPSLKSACFLNLYTSDYPKKKNKLACIHAFNINHCNRLILKLQPTKNIKSINFIKLKMQFSLTQKELLICQGICAGSSLEKIAKDIDREISTIRSHLKSLYSKTYTCRQAELVALIYSEFFD